MEAVVTRHRYRTIKQDERIQDLLDLEKSPKEIVLILELSSVWVVYKAMRRRRLFQVERLGQIRPKFGDTKNRLTG